MRRFFIFLHKCFISGNFVIINLRASNDYLQLKQSVKRQIILILIFTKGVNYKPRSTSIQG